MPKQYNVHVYSVVRTKVCGVIADSHGEAIDKAEMELLGSGYIMKMYPCTSTINPPESYAEVSIERGGDAEELVGYLVDEAHDADYDRSRHYEVPNEQRDRYSWFCEVYLALHDRTWLEELYGKSPAKNTQGGLLRARDSLQETLNAAFKNIRSLN